MVLHHKVFSENIDPKTDNIQVMIMMVITKGRLWSKAKTA